MLDAIGISSLECLTNDADHLGYERLDGCNFLLVLGIDELSNLAEGSQSNDTDA